MVRVLGDQLVLRDAYRPDLESLEFLNFHSHEFCTALVVPAYLTDSEAITGG